MSRKKFPIVPNKTEVNNFIEYFSDPLAYSGTHMCAATKTLTVKLNGDTHLCGRKLKIGNIHTTDPEKLWNGSKARVAGVQIMNCRKSCRILALNRGKLKTVVINKQYIESSIHKPRHKRFFEQVFPCWTGILSSNYQKTWP